MWKLNHTARSVKAGKSIIITTLSVDHRNFKKPPSRYPVGSGFVFDSHLSFENFCSSVYIRRVVLEDLRNRVWVRGMTATAETTGEVVRTGATRGPKSLACQRCRKRKQRVSTFQQYLIFYHAGDWLKTPIYDAWSASLGSISITWYFDPTQLEKLMSYWSCSVRLKLQAVRPVRNPIRSVFMRMIMNLLGCESLP